MLSPLTLEDGTSYLQLLNPTGGILGGDHLSTEIALGENTNVCLSTPSATRVYRTDGPPAVQDTQITVAPCATIEFLPDHLIPHPGSRLRQTLSVQMGEGSRGIFLDAFATGRQALGEHWIFGELDLSTEINLRGNLILLNRLKITPAADHPNWLGAMSGYSYAAALTVVDDHAQDWPRHLSVLREELDSIEDSVAGASLLPRAGLSMRLLTRSAIALSRAIGQLWCATRREVFHLPAMDLRKY